MASELTDQQRLAIDALIGGQTRTEASAAAGVDRVTLWRWLTNDANFVAALNEARQDIHSTNVSRLRNLASQAVGVLENSLASDNEALRLRAATSILKSVALSDIQRPEGETDPAVVETDITRRNLFNQML